MKHEQEKDATESESESDSQAKKLETLEALPKLPLCLPHYYIVYMGQKVWPTN